MATEVKVELVGMGDVSVHCGAGRNVSTSTDLKNRERTNEFKSNTTL